VLHGGHESVAFDFELEHEVALLARLLERADVVIEASRPRALQQLGIDARALVTRGPRVWLSITGYGRADERANAVAFGDDAAAAGGLVAWSDDGRPRFVADAVADPLTGIASACAVVDALQRGGRWMLDASLARVAAWVAGEDRGSEWVAGDDGEAEPPRARTPAERAPSLGEHTQSIVDEFGLA
jgi:crotonobetainyl-CoA:carnitine CoA-transferase CaiB-like acyl-CoA transferase